jgi:hypothetical protein
LVAGQNDRIKREGVKRKGRALCRAAAVGRAMSKTRRDIERARRTRESVLGESPKEHIAVAVGARDGGAIERGPAGCLEVPYFLEEILSFAFNAPAVHAHRRPGVPCETRG